MTTANLGEPLDVYAPLRTRWQLVICECGRRSTYALRDGKISLTGKCKEHMTPDYFTEHRYKEPDFLPQTPKRFRDTDPHRLHVSMQMATSWVPTVGKPGLLMHGTSGIGKTRAAWLIANRLWTEGLKQGYNLPVDFMPMREFEARVIEAFEDRRHSAALKEIMNADFLVLDDLGKERLTSRMATDLFSVIDARTEEDRPTVITTNFSGKAFLERFLPQDKETGIAIGRRIRDYFSIQGMSSHETKE